MKILKAVLISLGLSSFAFGGPAGPPGGAPILNQSFLQPNSQFNVSSGTAGQFTDTGLSGGGCVQAAVGGKFTTTGLGCGSGSSGSTSGSINVGNQYAPAFYSGVSTNIISGLAPATSGQVLTSGGPSSPPFYSSVVTASSAAATYLQLSSATATYLQIANASVYTSSSIVPSYQYSLPYYQSPGTGNSLIGDSGIITDGAGNLAAVSVTAPTITNTTFNGTNIIEGGTPLATGNTFIGNGGSGMTGTYFGTSLSGALGTGTAVSIVANPNSTTNSMTGVNIAASGASPTGLLITNTQSYGAGGIGTGVSISQTSTPNGFAIGLSLSASGGRAAHNTALFVSAGSTTITAVEGASINYGLVVGTLTINNVANTILAVDAFGHVISTTVTGGGGGGSTNGNIVASPQYQLGYYSGSGSTTTITGLPGVNSYTGYDLVLSTITASSGTVTGKLSVTGAEFITGTGASIGGGTAAGEYVYLTGGHASYGIKSLCDGTNTGAGGDCFGLYGTAISSVTGPSTGVGTYNSCAGNGYCYGTENFTLGTGTNTAAYYNASGGSVNHALDIEGGDISLTGSVGTNGQVFTSAGVGSVPTWTTISGGGPFVAAVSTTTLSLPLGMSVSTINLTGSGNAQITENGLTGQVVLSTAGTGVTVGHCAYFSSSMTLVDAGAACGTGGGGAGGTTGGINNATAPSIPVYSVSGSSNVLSGYAGFNYFNSTGALYVPHDINTSSMTLATIGGFGGGLNFWNSGSNNRQLNFLDDTGVTTLGYMIVSNNNFWRFDDDAVGPIVFQTQDTERWRWNYTGDFVSTSSGSFNSTVNFSSAVTVTSSQSGGAINLGAIIISTGATGGAGADYALQAVAGGAGSVNVAALLYATGTATTNEAGYFNATNGTNNHAIAIQNGDFYMFSGGAGTSGQALTSAGPGAVPTWTTISGGGGAGSSTSTVLINGVILSSPTTSYNYIPASGQLITGSVVGNQANLTFGPDTAVMLSRATDQANTSKSCISTTGNNTYTCNVLPALTAYTTNQCFTVLVDSTNVGAATLNINTLGAFSILSPTGGALTAGSINKNLPFQVCLSSNPESWIMASAPSSLPNTITSSMTFTNVVKTSSDVYLSSGSAIGFDEYQNGGYVATSTITWQNGNKQTVVLTANTTFLFNPPDNSGSQILRIQTGAGSFTASWPGSVKWSGGSAPTITATASKTDVVACYYSKQAATYYCAATQNF